MAREAESTAAEAAPSAAGKRVLMNYPNERDEERPAAEWSLSPVVFRVCVRWWVLPLLALIAFAAGFGLGRETAP